MKRCLWCFTLLMNLHDFVTEPVNPVHSFHDAHTVPFCLTADHISTCLMMFSARFKSAQFWSVLDYVVNGSVVYVLVSDVGMSARDTTYKHECKKAPRLHEDLTRRDTRPNHTTTGLALWSSLTLETRSHPWAPAGHPQYTGAHHDGEAVDGPITTTTVKNTTAHSNMVAERL